MGMLENQVQSAIALMQRTDHPTYYTDLWRVVYFIAKVTGNYPAMDKLQWIKKYTSKASKDPLAHNESFYAKLRFVSPFAANEYRKYLDEADMNMRLVLYVMLEGLQLDELFPSSIDIPPEVLAKLPNRKNLLDEIDGEEEKLRRK